MVVKHGFRLQKLERPVVVRNVDRTNNSGEAIIHQVYYKSPKMGIVSCTVEHSI